MIKTYNRQSIGRRNVIIAMVTVTCLIMYYQQVSASVIFNFVAFVLLLVGFVFIMYWPVAIILAIIKAIFHHKTSDVDGLDWYQFENYVADKLRASGYTKVKLTEKYDLGVDIIAVKDSCRLGVQVKHYKSIVGIEAVREAVAGLKAYNCNQSMVVTNSYFTEPAIKLAKCNNCILIDKKALNSL